MDFIVFGDDWGRHPSTTQHLIRHCAPSTKVIWIDSIGMRSPRLCVQDLARIWDKLCALLKSTLPSKTITKKKSADTKPIQGFQHLSPFIIPFHSNGFIRWLNTLLLKKYVSDCIPKLGLEEPVILTANPVAVYYLNVLPSAPVAYLRLDKYNELPGVDSSLVNECEPKIFDKACAIFCTAQKLLPTKDKLKDKALYLPQGVDIDNFQPTSLYPSGKKILGFFGLISEWIDFSLIDEVASKAPDWTLEFVGNSTTIPEDLLSKPNIRWLPPVPYESLHDATKEWSCAWIPFVISPLTEAVNPLKIREYLALGISSHCTPLPEVHKLSDQLNVFISENASDIFEWMEKCYASDSSQKRKKTQTSIQDESWSNRASTMIEFINRQSQEAK